MTPMDAVTAQQPTSRAATGAKHIVDVLIEERARAICGWLLGNPLSGGVLRRIFQYQEARELADVVMGLTGEQAFDLLANELNLELAIEDIAHVPRSGPAIIIMNHPTGLADGIAAWQTLRTVRRDLVFLANADALRVAPRFDDIIIPVEWRVGERTPAKSKVALVRSLQVLSEGRCLVIFPSGIPAIPQPILIDETAWLPTFVSLAAKTGAPIIPVAISAANSWLFYVFCILNKPMRHISLFREFVNKRDKPFRLRALAPRFVTKRPADTNLLASSMRNEVLNAARALQRK